MLSPLMTVVVLTVLWLIVVVPMVLRRSDERRQEKSVEGFGRAMRALGRRAATVDEPRSEVFVPRRRPAFDARTDAQNDPDSDAHLAAPNRRPVPAAQE